MSGSTPKQRIRSDRTENKGAASAGARWGAALVIGTLAGLVALAGALAFRASVYRVYMHSWDALYGEYLFVALPPLAVLVIAAARLRGGRYWRWPLTMLGALAGGALLGAIIGAATVPHESGPWAGGLIGAGALALIATVATGVGALRGSGGRRAAAGLCVLLASSAAVGCGPETVPAPGEARVAPATDTSRVESVVFLLGDPGVALMESYPVLPEMRDDINAWAAALDEDDDVRMLVLGDILYPVGLHPAGHDLRRRDSLRLVSQLEVVAGPEAGQAETRALFIPGNHDWGREEDFAGARRVFRLDEFLDAWAGPGKGRGEVTPDPGTGVEVRDVGDHLRLVLLDTAWWLLDREPGERTRFLDRIRVALAEAGDRRVVMAAHHPLETGGPHGAGVDLGSFLGVRALLKRAGILLQDLDSRPYDELKVALMKIFEEEGYPAIFAGGHDHSLQVFAGPGDPRHRTVVVGSASKLTGVTGVPGMRFGRSEPGYGKLLILDDGTLRLELTSAPARFLSCGATESSPETTAECMAAAGDAFRTVWRQTVEDSQTAANSSTSAQRDEEE